MDCEAIHCFSTASVRFAIYPDGIDGARIIARISQDALHDVFGARDGAPGFVKACDLNFRRIEARALERYRAAPSREIVLETRDFAQAVQPAAPPNNFREAQLADCPL